ncbi:MAG: hypothetical protein ABIJ34_08395 [archaeon]
MFDYSQYPKERVRVFFKYLANSANRFVRKESRQLITQKFEPQVIRENSRPIIQTSSQVQEQEAFMSDERKDELEIKINVFFSHNRLLPYELKLKRLKARIKLLHKRKDTKAKIKSLSEKIKVCEQLLKAAKKLEISGH